MTLADNQTDDIIGANITQWTENANYQPTVPVLNRFTGGPSVTTNRATPHPSPLSVLTTRKGRQTPSMS